MTKLGLDVGEKRIGLALSDPTDKIARPLGYLQHRSFDAALKEILSLIKQHRVDEVVVGLPLSLRGSDTRQTKKVREFSQKLASILKVEVTYWDERFTSVLAEKALSEIQVGRKKKRERVDQVSAALILQSYLNSKRSMGEEEK